MAAERWSGAGFEAGMEGALTLREAGRADEATRTLRRLEPTSAEDQVWRDEVLAELLVELGELDDADAVWARLERTDPDAARFGRARVARMRGEAEAALALLATSRDPRAAEERGLAYEALERWSEAHTAYEAMADSPDPERRSAAFVGQARVALAKDDPRGALAALARLTVVDAGYVLTAAQLHGDALLALGRVDEASDVYAGLDGDAEARTVRALGLGECALARDDAREALTQYSDALEGTTDRYYQADAVAGLVRALAQAGRAEQAQEQLARLRSGYPERADAIARAEAAINE